MILIEFHSILKEAAFLNPFHLELKPIIVWLLQCGILQCLFHCISIYRKSLEEVIHCFGVNYHQYVDDNQLYISTPHRAEDAMEPVAGGC